jgi:excisionase family DNA binding protein
MEKLMLRVSEAGDALGLGRSKTYELIASGELPSVRIGGSVRVPVGALRAWIEKKATESTDAVRS